MCFFFLLQLTLYQNCTQNFITAYPVLFTAKLSVTEVKLIVVSEHLHNGTSNVITQETHNNNANKFDVFVI